MAPAPPGIIKTPPGTLGIDLKSKIKIWKFQVVLFAIFYIFDQIPTISDARFEFSVKNYPGFKVQTWISISFINFDILGSLGPWQHEFFGPRRPE